MAKTFKSQQVMLKGVRAQWTTLTDPDTKLNVDGQYGIGVILNAQDAATLTSVIEAVANEAGVPALTLGAGDVAKVTLKASGKDRKTGREWTDRPVVYLPDLTPATREDLERVGKTTVFNVSIIVKPYDAFGKQGVGLRLAAAQIVTFEGGAPSAADLGFEVIESPDTVEAY